MAAPDSPKRTRRSVTLTRTAPGRFNVTNGRGASLTVSASDDAFTPTELLLAAIAGCTGLDVHAISSRRAEPESFELEAVGYKVRDEGGNRMTDLEVVFRVSFPEGESGDAAREVLPVAMQRSHDTLCTVSRTVYLGTPVSSRIEGEDRQH